MSAPNHRHSSGHTMAELLIVVLMTGLLAGIAVGGFSNLLPFGRQEAAVGKARILNAARCSYALTVPDAAAKWVAAADDAARVGLLRESRILEGETGDYLSSSGGYAIGLGGALRSPTQVTLNGVSLSYRQ